MAISKKGLRQLIVDNQTFYWKFNKKIFIYPEKSPDSLLIIGFGWYDIFDYIHDKETMPPSFEPSIVTPNFVAKAIRFTLMNGGVNGKVEIQYKNKEFILVFCQT